MRLYNMQKPVPTLVLKTKGIKTSMNQKLVVLALIGAFCTLATIGGAIHQYENDAIGQTVSQLVNDCATNTQPIGQTPNSIPSNTKASLQKKEATTISTQNQTPLQHRLKVQNKIFDVMGQWGMTDNPTSMGDVTLHITSDTIEGFITGTQCYQLKLRYQHHHFHGLMIPVHLTNSHLQKNTDPLWHLSGDFSIDEGYVKAFWQVTSKVPTVSNDSPPLHGWFFGELV